MTNLLDPRLKQCATAVDFNGYETNAVNPQRLHDPTKEHTSRWNASVYWFQKISACVSVRILYYSYVSS